MKLVFLDIDGTICMPGNAPSPATTAAIRSLREKGYKVFLSTGRGENVVPDDVAAIGFDGGIFNAGGRIVVDGKEIFSQTMPTSLVERIVSVLSKEGVHYTLECVEHLYEGNQYDTILDSDPQKSSSEMQRILEFRKQMKSVRDLEKYAGEPVFKISFIAKNFAQYSRIEQIISPFAKIVHFANLISDIDWTAGEVSAPAITKGTALEMICKYLRVTTDDCVAVGDSMDDAEILQAAGLGIAMGDSADEVKALADKVCGMCNEDGLAKALLEL